MSNGWAEYTPFDQACHRAGGRRLYNSGRSLKAALRRQRVVELLMIYDFARGSQAAIARRLGVHRSTVCRDVRDYWAMRWGAQFLERHLAGWSVAEIARGYGVRRSVVGPTLERALRVRALALCLGFDDTGHRGREGGRPHSDAEIAAALRLPEPTVRRYIDETLAENRRALREADVSSGPAVSRTAGRA